LPVIQAHLNGAWKTAASTVPESHLVKHENDIGEQESTQNSSLTRALAALVLLPF
jgi:hypothetical protein